MFLSDINKGEIFTNLLQSLNERAERGTFPELSLLSNSRKGREKSHDVIAQNTSGLERRRFGTWQTQISKETARSMTLRETKLNEFMHYWSIIITATAQSISKRVYLWGCMWPCSPTVGWFVIKGQPRLKEFLSLLYFTISSTFLCKKRPWHKHRIVSFTPLIGNT